MNKVLLVKLMLLCIIQKSIAQGTNNCLHFESNNYVELNEIAPELSGLVEFTIEFWVQFDGLQNTDYNTFYSVNQSNYGNRFLIRFAGPIDGVEDAAVVYINNGSEHYIIGSNPIGDNKCHHIAFTYQNGVCELFVDGQLDNSGYHLINFQATDLHSLGQEFDIMPTPTSQFYNGALDDFRIWNVAKSDVDIDTYKDTELSGNESNLITYFNFNQGISSGNNTTITSINNLAHPNQNGSLVNFNLNGSTSNFIDGTCVNSTIMVDENQILSLIEVSPNPTIDLLNVSSIESISSIIVRNTLGEIILNLEPNSTIDLSSLPRAFYFVEFETNFNTSYIRKVLKL